jgi:hypothetical protein
MILADAVVFRAINRENGAFITHEPDAVYS